MQRVDGDSDCGGHSKVSISNFVSGILSSLPVTAPAPASSPADDPWSWVPQEATGVLSWKVSEPITIVYGKDMALKRL